MSSSMFQIPLCLLLFVTWQPGGWVLSQALTCDNEAATATPSDQLGPFYVPDSPQTSNMGPLASLSDPLLRLQVHGQVRVSTEPTATDCLPQGVPNIAMEVWFAGPPDELGNFYQTNDYRGQVVTDANGAYNFTQVFPALYPARPILHNHVRLSDDSGELLVTQMYFAADPVQGWTADNGYVPVDGSSSRDTQTVVIRRDLDGTRRVEFNMYIDGATLGNSETVATPAPVLTPSTNPRSMPPTTTLPTTRAPTTSAPTASHRPTLDANNVTLAPDSNATTTSPWSGSVPNTARPLTLISSNAPTLTPSQAPTVGFVASRTPSNETATTVARDETSTVSNAMSMCGSWCHGHVLVTLTVIVVSLVLL